MAARVAALPDPRSGPAGVTPYKQSPRAAVVDFTKLSVPSAGKDSTLPLSPVAAGKTNRTDHVGCRNGQRRGHGPGRSPPLPKRTPPQGAAWVPPVVGGQLRFTSNEGDQGLAHR